ncbi:VWA domain-containing protein, partial [Candidatus Desantisbacteria bacterium]|nr:VWA domain-containing protein [Candidatus Desantisbacteria bacterium]
MLIENFFPLWFIIVLFISASVIIIFSYLRTLQNISFSYRYLLLGLKLAAVSMLIFAIFQPYLLIQKNIQEKSKIAVLVDVSPSMAVKDNKGISGLDKINSIFSSENSMVLDKLRKNNSVKLYVFSDYLKPFMREDIVPFFTQAGFRTQLSDALKIISREHIGNDLNGIILFSDGRDPSLAESLSEGRDFDLPVYTVGIGNEEKIKDIHLVQVEPDNIVYLDIDADITATIKTGRCQGESTDIVLMEEEKEIARNKFFIKKDGVENTKIKFKPLSSGWHRYSIVIAPLPGEQITVNNTAVFYLPVIQEKLKILFIEGTPGLDFKFIKKILEEDKNLEINYLVYKNKNEFFNIDKRFLTIFPDEKQLFKYNIIIQSSVPYSNLTDKQIVLLKNFVEKTGGGFLFLTGENSSGYAGSELEKILPVTFPKEHVFYNNLFNPVLTRDGTIHPVMRFDPGM